MEPFPFRWPPYDTQFVLDLIDWHIAASTEAIDLLLRDVTRLNFESKQVIEQEIARLVRIKGEVVAGRKSVRDAIAEIALVSVSAIAEADERAG